MRSFKHLENRKIIEFNVESNLFEKSLPIRAFSNKLTATFLIGIEQMVVNFLKAGKFVGRYFQV